MKNSGLRNLTAVLSKIIEVIGWFCAGLLVVTSIVLTISRNYVTEAYTQGVMSGGSVTVNGADTTEQFMESVGNGTVALELLPYVVLLIFTALIFRNIYMVFRKSNTASPFSAENIKRIKNIGYLAIALPIAKMVMQLITTLLKGSTDVMLSVSLSEFVFGLVALVLAQYFAYGAELERDVDGLL